jgi:hypothetical protein
MQSYLSGGAVQLLVKRAGLLRARVCGGQFIGPGVSCAAAAGLRGGSSSGRAADLPAKFY